MGLQVPLLAQEQSWAQSCPKCPPAHTWLHKAPENPGRHSQIPLMWWQGPLLCTQRGQGWAQPWP